MALKYLYWIYKLINNAPVKIERLKYLNTGLNFAQTQISVKTLCELGLIDEKDGVLMAMNVNEKTDLLNSETYKLIYDNSDDKICLVNSISGIKGVLDIYGYRDSKDR